jgi:hypothetical protein
MKLISILLLAAAMSAHAQYAIDWFTLDGGGGQSSGGAYTITGTIGQPDAHAQADGGIYSITGGFWALEDSSSSRPVLVMQRSKNVFIIAWPLTATGYYLQTTYDLAPPMVWQPVTSGITTNGGTLILQVTNTASVTNQFFRLVSP